MESSDGESARRKRGKKRGILPHSLPGGTVFSSATCLKEEGRERENSFLLKQGREKEIRLLAQRKGFSPSARKKREEGGKTWGPRY